MSDHVAPLTMLIVEDDSIVRDTLVLAYELLGYGVMSFSDGFAAQEWLNNHDLALRLSNLALVDIRMPGPRGHEIAAMIRKHSQLQNMGIVLMTAYGLSFSDEEQVLAVSGAERLILKSLPGMRHMQEIIGEVLAER